MKRKLTGLHFQYAQICELKTWLYHRRLSADAHQSQRVDIGSIIEEQSYKQSSGLRSPEVQIDAIEVGTSTVTVKETKKSSSREDAHRMQLLHYMVVVDNRFPDKEVQGVLRYPEEREQTTLKLDDNRRTEYEEERERIIEIVGGNPPEKKRIPACSSCAFEEFCWS